MVLTLLTIAAASLVGAVAGVWTVAFWLLGREAEPGEPAGRLPTLLRRALPHAPPRAEARRPRLRIPQRIKP